MRSQRAIVLFLVGYCVFGRLSEAFATLGGPPSGIASEARALKATSAATRSENYTVTQLVTENGVSILEYSAKGVVFAVTWRGNVTPDLSQILGDSYAGYVKAYREAIAAPRHSLRGPVVVQTSHVTIRREGHMRDWRGRAYDASRVPAGVDPEALP
jgi:hypothetical protein